MYIKKPILIICSVFLVIATVVSTIAILNPFGFTAVGEFLDFCRLIRFVDSNYYKDIKKEEYFKSALDGVAFATEDVYTRFIWDDNVNEFMEDVSGNYQGVGLYLENNIDDDTIDVVSAIPGSPADEAGIISGDRILKINDVEYKGSQLSEASAQIKGEKDTEVKITIKRASTGVTEDIVLVRREIKIRNVAGEMITKRVGKISISQFTADVSEYFVEEYDKLIGQGMEQLIIDLRNNPGGITDEAVEIAGLFIEEGKTVTYTLDKNKNRYDYVASDVSYDIPIVVLTNQGTASASEILTGALKDYGLCYHIGEKTYGKGVVQGVYEASEDSLLVITIARYYTPGGVCIHENGIEPDLIVEMDIEKYTGLANIKPEDDEQINAAIEYFNK
ncbi:MAG: S41 family peptidase [Clostridia bacterium]|nr:S41 family peptidase [Clostridia bacterium]